MRRTTAPVDAESSVTTPCAPLRDPLMVPTTLATHTWVPSEDTASGPPDPYPGLARTWTSSPVEADSSVTPCPFSSVPCPLAIHTCVPSEDTDARGSNL